MRFSGRTSCAWAYWLPEAILESQEAAALSIGTRQSLMCSVYKVLSLPLPFIAFGVLMA
jgi:hypothetical protein